MVALRSLCSRSRDDIAGSRCLGDRGGLAAVEWRSGRASSERMNSNGKVRKTLHEITVLTRRRGTIEFGRELSGELL